MEEEITRYKRKKIGKIMEFYDKHAWKIIVLSWIFVFGIVGFIALASATAGNHTLPTNILDTCDDGFLYCFSDWASDVTTGLFWVLALLTFCIIIYIASGRLGGVRAFGFASFVGMIGGIWLAILKLIPWWAGSSFILVGIIGIMALIISEKI